MQLSKFLQYKVIEADSHVSIIGAKRVVQGAHELIIADVGTCCEYLARYLDQRAIGKDIPEAHQQALKGARVIQRGHFDRQSAQ